MYKFKQVSFAFSLQDLMQVLAFLSQLFVDFSYDRLHIVTEIQCLMAKSSFLFHSSSKFWEISSWNNMRVLLVTDKFNFPYNRVITRQESLF